MQSNEQAFVIAQEYMLKNDPYSQWLGIKIEKILPGYAELSMEVREDMLNGFKVAHGGIAFSLADSALAFAANGYGAKCMSVQTQIKHLKPLFVGDKIKAVAKELSSSRRFGHYQVRIYNETQNLVAIFDGMVFNTGEMWPQSNAQS